MYLVVELLGKQYKVFEKIIIDVDRINLKENKIFFLNNILLLSSSKSFYFEKFILNKIFIMCRILKHFLSKKIFVFKFKRRKGYKKKMGFRKKLTKIVIERIYFNFLKDLNGSKKIWRII